MTQGVTAPLREIALRTLGGGSDPDFFGREGSLGLNRPFILRAAYESSSYPVKEDDGGTDGQGWPWAPFAKEIDDQPPSTNPLRQ